MAWRPTRLHVIPRWRTDIVNKLIPILLALGLVSASVPALSQPASGKGSRSSCFNFNQLNGWRAVDPKTIYIRVGASRYYRLDLTTPCQALRSPGAFLVRKVRGSNLICRPLDWDLHVARSWREVPQACIVRTMTELSPEEVAALPKGAKP